MPDEWGKPLIALLLGTTIGVGVALSGGLYTFADTARYGPVRMNVFTGKVDRCGIPMYYKSDYLFCGDRLTRFEIDFRDRIQDTDVPKGERGEVELAPWDK